MEEQFTFVPALLSDKAEIMKIYRDSMDQEGCTWSVDYPNETIYEDDVKRDAVFCLKNEEGMIVGAISVDEDDAVDRLDNWTWKSRNKRSGEIARLAVKMEYQNRGLAKRLFREVMDVLRIRGYDGVHLLVSPGNTAALRAYQKLNFRYAGQADALGRRWYCYEGDL